MPAVTLRLSIPIASVARDAARLGGDGVGPPRPRVKPHALDEAISWLCHTHDATGRKGSSKGFSLLRGWLPAYPETTGYVLGTLLAYAARTDGRPDLVQRAREMGDWEKEVQQPDGGVLEGALGTAPRRSIVFNTGMVLHGWLDLAEAGFDGYDDAAARAVRFLTSSMRDDGTWRPEVEYSGLPHTYNSRVAWAMLRWAGRHADHAVERAARLQLDWVCSRQRPNGWFDDCIFKPGTTPNSHAIAYTLRGLLESHALVGEPSWLRAVERTSERLFAALDEYRRLPANYDAAWRPTARHSCLTGTAQLGGVWLRLYQVTRDVQALAAGLKAVEQAAAFQETTAAASIRGAIAGSFPIWGRYAPLQYPNWCTKFLADSLMLHADCRSR